MDNIIPPNEPHKQNRAKHYLKVAPKPSPPADGYKRCSLCKQDLPATTEFFGPHKSRKDGLYEQCRICRKIRRKELESKERLVIPQGYKQCSQCKEIKLATTEFFHASNDGNRRYGVEGKCKVCRNLAQKSAYIKSRPVDDIPSGYKRCSKCHEVKLATLEFFPHSTHAKSELLQHCKQCIRAIHKETYAKRRNKTFIALDFKKCSKCGENKPATSEFFVRHAIGRDGLAPVCRGCQRTALQERYPSRRSHILAIRSLYRANNPDRMRMYNRNRYAKRKGAEGKYTFADLEKQFAVQKGKCYWCHNKFEKRNDKYVYHADHYIPLTREGTSNAPWNIVLACPHCNTSRGNKLPHEWPNSGRLL